MITLDEAQNKIDEAVRPLAPIKVPLTDAVGCKLTAPVIAPIDVPDFDCSIMDGIALHYDDLKNEGPWSLPIQKIIAAGDSSDDSLYTEHAVKIMTGAPLIEKADTVIKIEDVSINNGSVLIREKVNKGNFVRPAGDDIRKESILFDAGHLLTPIDAGVLASIGLTDIEIIPYPKIALFSTGSEIVEPGKQLKPGQRYDSNSTLLKSLLKMNGIPYDNVIDAIPDNPELLCETLKNCLEQYDLVITSGGVSMGDYDYIPELISKLGGQVLFHKIKVKPGKPVLVANINGHWLVALPGNPVSVAAGYHLHVRRLISRLMGQPFRPRVGMAELYSEIRFTGTRYGLIGAVLEETPNGLVARPSLNQNSGRLSSVKGINGFIMLDESIRDVAAGKKVYVEWLY